MREAINIQIPQEYKDNEEKGLCRVCGKQKRQWQSIRRKYCSDSCYLKYQECFTTWNGLRREILSRDRHCCVICGSAKELQVDHIKAIVNGGNMWAKDNLRVLCKECHSKKTANDVYLKNHLKDGQQILLETQNYK